ncbi:MAG TPA: DUF342 domain-containing protein [Firmicutes bacterium]|nr:DUF342 domain-containing protein [Bacillota bacterium]
MTDKVRDKVRIEISPDKLRAYLEISIPTIVQWPSFAELIQFLEEAGVKYGIDTDLLRKILRDKNQDRVVIAEGTSEVHGEDAEIKFYFNPEPKPTPKELADGSVDFKNIDLIRQVSKGDVLLEKIPPTAGIPGKDVTGAVLKPLTGRDLHLILGKNVKWDGMRVQAMADGIPVLEGRRIEVRTVYEVRGNVDYKTGNISFDGDVLVKGDVQCDFSVQATGSIFVIGNIDGGSLQAGEDISVSGGIIGYGKSRIICSTLYAGYINNAIIEAEKEVKVRDAVLHSQVTAGQRIIVKGKKGCIYGGVVKAGESIETLYLGSKMGTTTEVELGVKPGFRLELEDLDRQLTEVEAGIALLKQQMEGMDGRFSKLTPEEQETKVGLVRNLQYYQRFQQELITKKNALLYEMKEFLAETGYIKAHRRIYQGVKVKIGAAALPIKYEVPFTALISCKKGEIVIWQQSSRRLAP